MPGRSAVIVPIVLPPGLLAIRTRADRMAARGVPPHVTVLFPFLPADALTPEVRLALRNLAAAREPFAARFDRVECLDQMVWLLPADQLPFLRLTAQVTARWPDYPPYEGVHDELIAHLTLVETSDVESLSEGCAAASRSPGFDVAVDELRVITEDAAGRWHDRWRLALGATSSRPGPDA
jgi:2'-5' RNA ligase